MWRSIGPFAQCGLDKALSLAIGPGRIGPCADMFQARVTASSGKGFRDIAAAITGHDTGHFHTGPLVPGDDGPEGNNSTERFFIGMDLAEGEARMVVNADMHIFPAIAANRSAARADWRVRLPVTRWPGRSNRPSFLMSRWIRSPGASRS